MWLIVRKSDSAVIGTAYQLPPARAWDPDIFEVKEWLGPEPVIHDPDADPPVYSYDPTLADPDYAAFKQARQRFDELANQANSEIVWLEDTIPQINTMTIEEVRDVVKRLARENLETLRAWRYVLRRL